MPIKKNDKSQKKNYIFNILKKIKFKKHLILIIMFFK